ncbi:SDR family oxidoreductase [Chondrinema litorale]|uniref:SDR family oxidoreductase n=1 Tax=Chondrinema litorale TaxID=2994555 RepID=UPI002543E5BC|nr:SDR family NAD(P)-dependent oxidoreductase [Chondrinema litorale]UZR98699.1 SDR family NAD(P)-dependent oxidoreductase [Chondrinema litorale]
MTLINNTVLITGGSSGIGFKLAEILVKNNNQVIICSRSEEKLKRSKELIPELHIIQCDLATKEGCMKLTEQIKRDFPSCNILVNNAAVVHKNNFYTDNSALEKSDLEIQTNLIAPIYLSKLFIPVISKNKNAKIININSGLAYLPRAVYPIYNATKAALHSFTQVLRMQLSNTNIDVIEVMFPAVDTPWHNGNTPKIAISADAAVNEMLVKLSKNKKEIRIGKVNLLYKLYRIAPKFALKKLNDVS